MYPKTNGHGLWRGRPTPTPTPTACPRHAHGTPTSRPRHILPRVESLLRYYVLSEIKSRTTFFELRTWRQRIVRVYIGVCVCMGVRACECEWVWVKWQRVYNKKREREWEREWERVGEKKPAFRYGSLIKKFFIALETFFSSLSLSSHQL